MGLGNLESLGNLENLEFSENRRWWLLSGCRVLELVDLGRYLDVLVCME